jgi:mersacidin/lichenicidin family type 2 lantibiotic
MAQIDVIRAWKDQQYRQSLDEAERNQLPDNPAGIVELSDADLDTVFGMGTYAYGTLGCCGSNIICLGTTFAMGSGGCCWGGLLE